jgi:cobaltochelatase CobS
MEKQSKMAENMPHIVYDAQALFGIQTDWKILGYKDTQDNVPDIDPDYIFDPDTTLAILAGFVHNRRVMIQGFHGTGKSTHIEQIAARLKWPCIRINLDSHVSRLDLLGKDTIAIKDGKQITEFKEGLLPWALQNPVALVFDEYDAGRPDIMFVIQRVLEQNGHLTLLDQNKIIKPHPAFRLFATTNTIGLGDMTGLYHGTQQLNQAQLDRWHIVSALNYLDPAKELKIILGKVPQFDNHDDMDMLKAMIEMANLTRQAFANGDVSTVMSPRTVISWAENIAIFNDCDRAFHLSFLNRCDESEHDLFKEFYQRCFGVEL